MPPKRRRLGTLATESYWQDVQAQYAQGGGPGGNPRTNTQFRRRRGQGRRGPPKSSNRKSYGRGLKRKFASSSVPRPLVHRKTQALTHTIELTGDMNPHLEGLTVKTPDLCWGSYERGFDITQTAGNALRSKNVACQFAIIMPSAVTAPQPYRFRVIQGFAKTSVVNLGTSSTAGIAGVSLGDGYINNFNAGTAWDAVARQCVADNIGNQDGDGQLRGLVNSRQIHVISDQFHTVAADATTTNPAGGDPVMVYNKQITRTMNWKTNTAMRLIAYTAPPGGPPTAATNTFAPVNNPSLWTPFIAVCLINATDYTVAGDAPTLKFLWSHYWDDM